MQGIPCQHPPGAVCMISGEITRYALSMQSLTSLIAPAGSVLSWHMGMLVARSLNDAFQNVMDNPTLKWAWIMGDDHTFRPEILLKLLERNLPAVVPLCLNRVPPMDATILVHPGKQMKPIDTLPAGGLYRLAENETCGDAGLLLRREVLERTGPIWYERLRSGALSADDQEFIEKIKRVGYDVWVDLDHPIGHIGPVTFLPIRKATGWEVRMVGGGHRHICDVVPVRKECHDVGGNGTVSRGSVEVPAVHEPVGQSADR